MFLKFLYLVVYPSLYSGSAFRIPLSIFSDIFAFGPFVTLPIAYIIQSVMAGIAEPAGDDDNTKGYDGFFFERVHRALEKYKNHIIVTADVSSNSRERTTSIDDGDAKRTGKVGVRYSLELCLCTK